MAGQFIGLSNSATSMFSLKTIIRQKRDLKAFLPLDRNAQSDLKSETPSIDSKDLKQLKLRQESSLVEEGIE